MIPRLFRPRLCAVGDTNPPAYCSCTVSYSRRRETLVIIADDPDCPIHHPKDD